MNVVAASAYLKRRSGQFGYKSGGFDSPNRLEGKVDSSVKCSEGAEQRLRFKGCGAVCGHQLPYGRGSFAVLREEI